MGLPAKKIEKKFTYKDYLSWSDEERWELIDGVAYNMSPAPSRRHQEILGELYRQIATYLLDKPCRVYVAPFDVRLPENDEVDDEVKTVVQPDIVVICEKNKLDDRGGRGAPDIVIEISSPYTTQKDLVTKYHLYERHKIPQYWIFDQETEKVIIYKLKNDKYGKAQEYKKEDKIKVDRFKDLEIDLGIIFKTY